MKCSCGSRDRPMRMWERGAHHAPDLEAIEHTLAYDAACMGDYRPPTARLAKIRQPTLVATGGPSMGMGGLPPDFFEQADAIVASIPRAEHVTLAGRAHVADSAATAPMLDRFFGAKLMG